MRRIVMDVLSQELEKIQLLEIEDTEAAFQAFSKLETTLTIASDEVKREFYVQFALFMFRSTDYNKCMDLLMQAQEYGFPKENIRQFIYENFVEPNLQECRFSYEENIQRIKEKLYVCEIPTFDQLSFWFIPTMSKDFVYFYDQVRETIVCSNMDWRKIKTKFPENPNVFSDYLFAGSGDIYEIFTHCRQLPEKKGIYIYVQSSMYFFAFLQHPDIYKYLFLMEKVCHLFDSLEKVRQFFLGTESTYLPRNCISNLSSMPLIELENLIKEIHEVRIQDSNRKRDKILLTIGIPSYNRGHRAYENVMYHLQAIYDDEIEIVVCNNGSTNDSKDLYTKIGNLKDQRVSYWEFEKVDWFPSSASNVYEKSRGKFVLLTSDEDVVNLKSLDKILQYIYTIEDLALIKIAGNGRQVVPSTKLTNAGIDSLLEHSLTAYHIYGNIMNREILEKYSATQYIRDHIREILCATYPNIYLELLLCQHGKVLGIDDIVILEGKPEPRVGSSEIEVKYYDAKNNEIVAPNKKFPKGLVYFQTVEGRLKQHKQILNIFKTFKLFRNDFQVMQKMYRKLCVKTFYLVNLSQKEFYQNFFENPEESFKEMFEKTYQICKEGLEEVYAMKNANQSTKGQDEHFLKQLMHYYIQNKEF